jgi:hypothetical protein
MLDPEYWNMEHDDGGEMMDAFISMVEKTYYMPGSLTGECCFRPIMAAAHAADAAACSYRLLQPAAADCCSCRCQMQMHTFSAVATDVADRQCTTKDT